MKIILVSWCCATLPISATIAHVQTWSFPKLADLKVIFDSLKSELVVYRDEKMKELFDVPDAPVPDAYTTAPVRFLPECDNILLSHKVRTRVFADDHRKKVYLPGLRVAATILVDGFISAV